MDPSNTPSSLSVYSDCDCYLCQYARDQKDPESYPFGRTARNPTVYYAQCIHGKKKDCSECRKPNVFVRAFRWYTNEHGAPKGAGQPCKIPTEPCKKPCQEECSDKTRTRNTAGADRMVCSDQPNISAFATWLDSKYHQYLIENAAPDACRMLYNTQTSVIETCNAIQEDPMQSGSCGRRRFSKQRGNGRNQPYNPSTEFIMPPKNLSRAASDCCYAPLTASGDRHIAKSRSATATICIIKSGYDNAEFAKPPVEQTCQKCKDKSLNNRQDATCQYTIPIGRNAQTQYEPSRTTDEGIPSSAAKNKQTKQTNPHVICQCQQTKPHVICQCPATTGSTVTFNTEGKADVKPIRDGIKQEKVRQQQEKAQPMGPNVQTCPNIQKPCPSISQQQQFQFQDICSEVKKPGPCSQPPCSNVQICPNIQKPCPSITQQQQLRYQGTYSKISKPGPKFQHISPNLQESYPSKTQQQQFQYQDTYSERQKPGPNYQPTCPNVQTCPEIQKPCPSITHSTYSKGPKLGPNLQQILPNLQESYPNKTQQQQFQYQDTYTEGLKPGRNYQRTCPNEQTCPNLQQPCPSKTLQQYQSTNSKVPQPGPNFQEIFPELQRPYSQQQQAQYQDTYSEVQKTCPNFQLPCPNLGGPTDKTCPSLRDPCVGRRPCPSLRKMCPPCPSHITDPSKASAQQGMQNVELNNNTQLQYKQSYHQNNQAQQEKTDLQTQTSGNRPTLRDCCFANTYSMNCIQKQDPRVGAMPLKQEGQSFRQYAANVDSRPCVQSEIQPRQEEYSFREYAANVDSRPSMPDPSFQETSAGTNTYSVHNQGTTLLYSQLENIANCYCSNCYPSGLTYEKAVCCRTNESVQLPAINKNVFITTSTGEGKCSVNCPYYATVSIKGQTTQTSQTVQFSQSVDHTVQTSDTAIRLDRETILEYPLFMRVVCADKLQ